MPAPLIDRTEAAVFAAILESLRNGSGLPIRRPSWTDPTIFSRPLTATAITAIASSTDWQTILTMTPPTQYFTAVKEYAVASYEAVDPTLEFRITVDGFIPQGVSLPVGIDLCKDVDIPWPLQRRAFPITLNPPQRLSIDVRYSGVLPRTVLVGLWGWHYPSIQDERSTIGQGNTDA